MKKRCRNKFLFCIFVVKFIGMTTNGKILVVEDTQAILIFLTNLLEIEGYTVFAVDSGELALSSIENVHPDLILLDIYMPGINGLEVCKILKADETYTNIPVIFLSAATEISERLEGLRMGAVDYISKPFHDEELLARVKTHLEIFKLNETLKQQAEQIKNYNEQLSDFNRDLEEKVKKRTIELQEKNDQFVKLYEELLFAKKNIEDSEKKYRLLFENMISGFQLNEVIVDKNNIPIDFRIIDGNKQMENYTGYSIKAVKGKTISQMMPNVNNKMIEAYGYVALTGEGYNTEYFSTTYNKYFKISAYCPTKGQFAVIFDDITKRKLAEETLKESEIRLKKLNEDKDKFFSIIAHDLKGPFSNNIGLLDLLQENIYSYPLPKIEKFVNIINLSTKNVYSLLDNLLVWAKSQRGISSFKPEQINLSQLCIGKIDFFYETSKQKMIDINCHLDTDIEITADVFMLKTILQNLISNAIKFTHKFGKIDLSAIETSDQVEITVADTGVGMDEETQSKLFRLDVNLTTTGTAEEQGTGLGLIICKEFVEKHNGKIWVESKVNKGSAFKFTIPKMNI